MPTSVDNSKWKKCARRRKGLKIHIDQRRIHYAEQFFHCNC